MKGRKVLNRRHVFILIICVGLISAISPPDRYFQIAKNLDIFATLFKEVNVYYVDEVDPDQLINTGIDAMLTSLDPYTNYIPEEDLESFRTMTTGQYAGIGALIGKLKDRVLITMPYEGAPAYNSGLKVGDEIIAVDGKEISESETADVSAMLKGPANTTVEVKIKRYGEKALLTFSITRETITVDNVPYFGIIHEDIGYIKLDDFTTEAGREVADAVKDLKGKGANKIILDLRGNPGGLLSEAVNVSNVFIPKGREVVSTRGKMEQWNKTYKTLNQPTDTEIPLIVLTNGGSASASEIVSGVIQDYDRGILVGSKTFGKGLVQATRPLSYNAQLKVTTARYYIPSGRCIQALDYSHRNEDGSVNKTADSARVKFKTALGRTVYDGQGLDPDKEVEHDRLAPISISLISKGLIFDYAIMFNHDNDIQVGADKFSLTDNQYMAFVKWLQGKDYDYTTKVEEEIENLENSSKREKYYNDIHIQLTALKKKVQHNKENDLMAFKPEIKSLLEEEIVAHKYNFKGRIISSLNDDPDVLKAVEIFKTTSEYSKILSAE